MPTLERKGYVLANGVNYYYRIFMAPALATTVLPFLNGGSAAPSRANQVNQER